MRTPVIVAGMTIARTGCPDYLLSLGCSARLGRAYQHSKNSLTANLFGDTFPPK